MEAVQDSQFRFRTTGGKILRADASQMQGRAPARVNDQGTLIYEPGPRREVTALWLERQETQPSAAVIPRTVGPGEYQRIYGYVQSVGWSTMPLPHGAPHLRVDLARIDCQCPAIVGLERDLVSVVGKTTTRADQFVAEVIERESRR